MMKRQMMTAVMTIVMSAALCVCSGGKIVEGSVEETSNTLSEEIPVTGGSVVFGMTQDLASLDPHIETDAGTRDVVFNLYEGLVKPASNGDLVPAVASDVKISDDAKTYTFTLREGVTFHDGTAVTVEDVKYSIDRYAEAQGESSAFSIVSDVVIQDEKTIVVNLKESYSEFLAMMVIAIIPESNEDITGNPIGTGPYKFVSYTPGQNIILEKHDGYWKENSPSLDQVEFKFIADVDTAFVELQAATIDIMKYLTAAQASVLGEDYNIIEGSMNMVHGMFMNSEYEPLNNLLVRQAICYAVDREAVNNFIENKLDILRFDSHIISDIKDMYIADMQKYVKNSFETVKIEKVYKNIPSQLAKDNKNFKYNFVEETGRKRKYESSIDWLVASKMILINYNAKRMEIPLKVYIDENTFKLYLSDVGILTNMSEIKFPDIMLDNTFIYKGAITENYVAQELTSKEESLYYWTSKRSAEIDFILYSEEDGIIPIIGLLFNLLIESMHSIIKSVYLS